MLPLFAIVHTMTPSTAAGNFCSIEVLPSSQPPPKKKLTFRKFIEIVGSEVTSSLENLTINISLLPGSESVFICKAVVWMSNFIRLLFEGAAIQSEKFDHYQMLSYLPSLEFCNLKQTR